ncbi:hypothetical protein ACFYXF_12315 [Streptomyces sp. NPDC002680]|uniref:hypothetical protein n=1 Tax=Streptomyces sp. NPDC002680 TaxID=3364659 RepID=UPI00368F05CF
MAAIWAGIDAGKTHHHCVAIDESGQCERGQAITDEAADVAAAGPDHVQRVVRVGDLPQQNAGGAPSR